MTKQYFKNQMLKYTIIERRSRDFDSIVAANMKRCALYVEASKEPWYPEYNREYYYNSHNKRCITF